jgi:guanylate kinase
MPKYLIIIGPSGAGKSTVIKHLLKKPLFELSVSYTTRKPRPGEQNGVHYCFTTDEDFEKKITENFFLEYTELNGYKYGTPCLNGDPDKIIIFDIEIDGFKFFKKNCPRSFFCLIKIERGVIESRLRHRMMSLLEDESLFDEEEYTRRMNTYDQYTQIENEYTFDYVIDNSGSMDNTLKQINELADIAIDHFEILNN